MIQSFVHRPFPTNFCEAKHAMVSYSQFGEDLLVQELIGFERKDVFYIDIGAFHPMSKSNTYVFYKRGGRGICVEPNPTAKKLWDTYRSRDLFFNAGATGSESGPMSYLPDSKAPSQNRFVHHSDETASGDSVSVIDCLNIADLVKANTTKGQTVDLLSIDCEGMDHEILCHFPYDHVRPKVVIVEDFDFSDQSDIHQLLVSKGYGLVSIAKISKIFLDQTLA
jgi:FkbM family methyltransferase